MPIFKISSKMNKTTYFIKVSRLLMFKFLLVLTSISFVSHALSEQDFLSIQRQATLANIAYLDANDIKTSLLSEDQTLIHQATLPDSQVSYFLSRSNGVQTIAVRGTANLENALVDVDLALQFTPALNIILHQGFAAATQAIYQDVKPYLIEDMPIATTGHSLGGAVAVILAMHLAHDHYPLQQVMTFGQPKVTNVAGAKAFAALPLIRVVTPHDIVPLVPPLSPLQIKDLDIYWHIGEEVILLGDHEYSQTNGVKSMLRATKFTSSIPDEKNLIAHKMTTYLTLIEQLLESPTSVEVPYKMEINFFGISFD